MECACAYVSINFYGTVEKSLLMFIFGL